MSYQGEPLGVVAVTITSGTALSPAVALGGAGLTRILMPAAWTAAGLTMQYSVDGVTFSDVYNDDGTEWAGTVAAGHAVTMDVGKFNSLPFIKLRSGTGAAPVNQGADRVVTLVTRPY